MPRFDRSRIDKPIRVFSVNRNNRWDKYHAMNERYTIPKNQALSKCGMCWANITDFNDNLVMIKLIVEVDHANLCKRCFPGDK